MERSWTRGVWLVSALAAQTATVACDSDLDVQTPSERRDADVHDARDAGVLDRSDTDAGDAEDASSNGADGSDTEVSSCDAHAAFYCAAVCGTDYLESATCQAGVWACKAGTQPISACLPGTCFTLPGRCCAPDGTQGRAWCDSVSISTPKCPAGMQFIPNGPNTPSMGCWVDGGARDAEAGLIDADAGD